MSAIVTDHRTLRGMEDVLTLERDGGAYKIYPNPVWYPTDQEIQAGAVRGEITARGPWQIITFYKALAVSGETWNGHPLKVYGIRTLSKCREAGYELEGKVSVAGKQYRGFTSSVLLQLPDGKLLSVAAIHVCVMNDLESGRKP